MRVVVVGGSGNISVSIVEGLIAAGHEVICFNRGITNAEPLPPQVRFVHGDRNDEQAFIENMQNLAPDAAIDMVCFNAQQAQCSVKAFSGVKSFVFCSTVCVYGVTFDTLPLGEDAPLHPSTPYGKDKKAAEDVFMQAHKEYGFPVTIMRPAVSYGNQNGLVGAACDTNLWVSRILNNMPIAVCGNGNNLHQFMHVRDVAKVFVSAVSLKKAVGQTYNVVTKTADDWNKYYKTGMNVLGRQVPVVGIPRDLIDALGAEHFGLAYDIFGHNCYYGSEKLYRDFADFKPTISLHDGMSEVIEFCKQSGTLPPVDTGSVHDRTINALLKLRGGV